MSGISWLAESFFFEKESLKEISEFVGKNYKNWIKKGESFAIRLKKGVEIKEKREKIIEEIAKNIKRKVDLERSKKEIFFGSKKMRLVPLFQKRKRSRGFASWNLWKGFIFNFRRNRFSSGSLFDGKKGGVENIWLHFHSFPLVSKRSVEKVKELAKIFLYFQPKIKVYFLLFPKFKWKLEQKFYQNTEFYFIGE